MDETKIPKTTMTNEPLAVCNRPDCPHPLHRMTVEEYIAEQTKEK